LRTNDAPYELSQLDTAQRTELFEELAERDLRSNGPAYREYEVRYIYALDEQKRFAGHVSVRELLLSPHGRRLCDVGTKTLHFAVLFFGASL
jgi:hypothetical protein